MTEDQLQAVFDRVRQWPRERQEDAAEEAALAAEEVALAAVIPLPIN